MGQFKNNKPLTPAQVAAAKVFNNEARARSEQDEAQEAFEQKQQRLKAARLARDSEAKGG